MCVSLYLVNYTIFGYFWEVIKRSKVLICYLSRSAIRNILMFIYFLCVFHEFLIILWHLHNILQFLDSYEKNKFLFVIRHDILR